MEGLNILIVFSLFAGFAVCQQRRSICPRTENRTLKASFKEQFITSSRVFYSRDSMCTLHIVNPTSCSMLRLDTIGVERLTVYGGLSVTSDGEQRTLVSNYSYIIHSNNATLTFRSYDPYFFPPFNVSYVAVGINVTTKMEVFGCQQVQLLAEEHSKYVYSSKYPNYNRDTDCQWRIHIVEPCTMTDKVNSGKTLKIVVNDFRSIISTTIDISQGKTAVKDSIKVRIGMESPMVGQPLYFYDSVLVTARHMNANSVFKFSYELTDLKVGVSVPNDCSNSQPTTEPHESSSQQQTTDSLEKLKSSSRQSIAAKNCESQYILLACGISVLVITVIAHVLVRRYCGKRSSETQQSNNLEMQNTAKENKDKPCITVDKPDINKANIQGEISTGEIYDYEVVDEESGSESNEGRDYLEMITLDVDKRNDSHVYINIDISGRGSAKDKYVGQYENVENYEDVQCYKA